VYANNNHPATGSAKGLSSHKALIHLEMSLLVSSQKKNTNTATDVLVFHMLVAFHENAKIKYKQTAKITTYP
jgi:hypothetical protein